MSMKKDIEQFNSKGQRHGYQEWYWDDGESCYKGNHYNGERVGLGISPWANKIIYNV